MMPEQQAVLFHKASRTAVRRALFAQGLSIYVSQVDGRDGQPTLGQGKPSTGRRAARARGRDASSQADPQIAHLVVLSLS